MRTLFLAAIAALGVALATTANATVITFSGLAGANQSPFTTYTESGYTVTPTLGSWFQAQGFGNPVPSIFIGPIGAPSTSRIDVTGGLFTFTSVDLSSNGAPGTSYSILGLRSGGTVLTGGGTIGNVNSFNTVLSTNTAIALDDLQITLTPGNGTSSANLDNIVVNAAAVPEPLSLALLGTGLAGLALVRRRNT